MKLQSIQVLRGLAALLVVFYHLRALEGISAKANGLTEPNLLGGVITNGYAGVDLFFVISGFIMVFVTQGAPTGIRAAGDFLFARATRIYPIWWIFAGILTIYLVTAYGMPGGPNGWKIHEGTEPTLEYFVRSFLLMPQPEFPVLGVGWTLVHEVYFYAVFALFLLLPRKLLPLMIALWAAMILTGTYFGFDTEYAGTFRDLAFYPMTMEFILGAVAGLAITSGYSWRPGIMTLIATLWLLAALCLQGVETGETLKWGRVLWYGLPCALLVHAVAGLELKRRLAWLVPATLGLLAGITLFQLSGITDASPDVARQSATLLAVIIAGLTMLAVLWIGWLLGQSQPAFLRATLPFFKGLLNKASSLGDWSFSLYLSHIIVLSTLRLTFEALGRQEALAPFFRIGSPGPLDNLLFMAIGLVASVIAAWLSYRLIEKPWIIGFNQLRAALFRMPANTARQVPAE